MPLPRKHHITTFLLLTTLVCGYFFQLAPEVFADNYTIIIDSTAPSHEIPCVSVDQVNNDCSFSDVFVGGNAAAIPFSLDHHGRNNRNFKISIADNIDTIGLPTSIPIQFSGACNNCTIELDGAKTDGSKTKIVPSTSTPPATAFLIGEDIGNITIKNFDFQGFSAPAIIVQNTHTTQVEISDTSFGQTSPSTQPNNTALRLNDADHVLVRNNVFGRQTDNGIAVHGSSTDTTIQGNVFGVGSSTNFRDTLPSIQNDAISINDQSQNTHILENVITNTGRNGISIIGGVGHEIGLNNRFFNNTALAVALASRGNNQTRSPVLTAAYRINGHTRLVGTADSGSQIQIYQANNASNPAVSPDADGGEGFRMLQSLTVDSSDDQDPVTGQFLFTLNATDLIVGDSLSAIKTLNHNSSAFSNNVVIVDKQVPTITVSSSPPSPQSGTTVTLNATATDSDSRPDQLVYQWTQTAGPNVTLSTQTSASSTFTVPTLTSPVTLIFTVTVTDETGLSANTSVTVNATPLPPTNIPPVANAGPDQTVASNTQIQLDGTSSTDADNEILTYHWTQATSDSYTVELSSTTSSRPQFITPSITELQIDLHFTLQVTDPHGAQASDDSIVHVSRTRLAPSAVLNVRSGNSFLAGTEITLDGSSSTFDSTSTVHHYRFRHVPNSSSDLALTVTQTNQSASTAKVTLPSTISASRDYTFELIVNDGTVDSAPVSRIVHSTVPEPTTTPTATPTSTPTSTSTPTATPTSCSTDAPIALAGDTISRANTPGQIITLNGSLSSDPHNYPLTYYWRQLAGGPRVPLRNDQSPTPNFTIPSFTDPSITINFQLTVTNTCGRSSNSTVRVTIGSDDPDHDELDTQTEERLGTDPHNQDTDGDGIPDGAEISSSCMNPLNPDSDNDGIRDGSEDLNRSGITDGGETNPCLADTDHDGMPDGFETKYQINPTDPRDANEDSDNDGLTNQEEFIYKTNPRDADTDHDSLTDGIEIKTSHTTANKDDTDGDGILDGNEDLNHNGLVDPGETNPNKFDSDGDSLSDGLEIGLNKPQGKDTDLKKFQPDLDALSKTNALTADTDGDKLPDGNEDTNHNGSFDCGETNPLDPTNKVTLCTPTPKPTATVIKQPRIATGFSISVKASQTQIPTKQGGIVTLGNPRAPVSKSTQSQFSIIVSKGSGKQTRITIPTITPLSSISVIPSIMLPTTGPVISSILVYAPIVVPVHK